MQRPKHLNHMDTENVDYFGCISKPWGLNLPELDIVPDVYVEYSFNRFLEELSKQTNNDGFLYPPIVYSAYSGHGTEVKPIPNSKRPAHMWQAPASHRIVYKTVTRESARMGIAGFIIHLLGFLVGQTAQFFDWQVTGRIPIKAKKDFCFLEASWHKYVETALTTWHSLDADGQKRLTNILYCRGRIFAYESFWEEFVFNYMLADSIWRFKFNRGGIPHSVKIPIMCKELNLHEDAVIFKKIINLRNEIFHESLWAKGMPGYTLTGIEEALHLGTIVEQLIVRCLGFTAKLPPWTLSVNYSLE